MVRLQKNQYSILIVEDSPTQLERLRFILESSGHEIRAARHGKEAIAMLAEARPELVISDVNMPEMDGYELCMHIKSDQGFAKIPVILLTDLSGTANLLRGLECGADSYITKPYDEADLLNGIRQVLESESGFPDENPFIVPFGKEKYRIDNNASKILNFLMTTYDLAVKKNVSLAETNTLLFNEIAERKRVSAERENMIVKLQKALDEIKTLRGIIPICMYCKKIKGDKNVWDKLEEYIEKHSDADFSHGICPDCLKIQLEEVKRIKE